MRKLAKLISCRNINFIVSKLNRISTCPIRYQEQKSSTKNNTENKTNETSAAKQPMVKLNPLEKRIVYAMSRHQYSSVDEVPDFVPYDRINFAYDVGKANGILYTISVVAILMLFGSIIGDMQRARAAEAFREELKKLIEEQIKKEGAKSAEIIVNEMK